MGMSDNEFDDGGNNAATRERKGGDSEREGEDEDFLYDDLELDRGEAKTAPVAYETNKSHSKAASAKVPSSANATAATTDDGRPYSLVEEVVRLQQQVHQLQTDKQTLERNMGILYRTATSEIQRQRYQIESLQLQLLAVAGSAAAAAT